MRLWTEVVAATLGLGATFKFGLEGLWTRSESLEERPRCLCQTIGDYETINVI